MKKPYFAVAVLATTLLCSCSTREDLWIGTYGENIYKACFDGKSFQILDTLHAADPTWLYENGEGVLYAASHRTPGAYACSFDACGQMSGICHEIGDDPCFINKIDGTPYIMTAEYNGGSVSVFGTNGNGAICERVQCLQFKGCGPHRRQTRSHVHQVKTIPSEMGCKGTWVLATNLGADSIHVMKYCGEDSVLTVIPGAAISCGAGSGPRHMEFNTSAGVLYCVTEISCEILAWKVSSSEGGAPVFTPLQRVPVEGVSEEGGADIHLSPDGKFIYASFRRGNDGIAIYKVLSDGTLESAGYCNCALHPRNFHITADGRYVLVGGMDENLIQIFKRNRRTGLLSPTGGEIRLEDKPVCIIRSTRAN